MHEALRDRACADAYTLYACVCVCVCAERLRFSNYLFSLSLSFSRAVFFFLLARERLLSIGAGGMVGRMMTMIDDARCCDDLYEALNGGF